MMGRLRMTFSLYPFLSNSCRYYGLSVWFPDVIKHLQADEYASKVQWHTNEQTEDFTFNFTLENQIHTNSVFINDRYTGLIKHNKYKCITERLRHKSVHWSRRNMGKVQEDKVLVTYDTTTVRFYAEKWIQESKHINIRNQKRFHNQATN